MQPALGFLIDSAHQSKHLGGALFRDALAGNDLKAAIATRRPIATSDVATVQSHCDRRSRFWRGFDLKLAAGVISELFRPEFGFEPLGSSRDVLAYGLLTHTAIDRQHVVQQLGDSAECNLRCPFGLDKLQFRCDMRREYLVERTERSGGRLLTSASAPTWASQRHVAVSRTKPQRVITLDYARSRTVRTGPCADQVFGELLPNDDLLELAEDRFGFGNLKSDIIDVFAAPIYGFNRYRERQDVGALELQLNREFHGRSLRVPLTTPQAGD